MIRRYPAKILSLTAFITLLHLSSAGAQQPKNDDPLIFAPYPKASDGRGWTINHFGPVGLGIHLGKGFEMKVHSVEKGSPADQTGKLKKGQIIKSINGVTLGDSDPRMVLAQIITDAEASDGKVNLVIKDEGVVTVTIPVLGSYSKTWPLDCEKSEKIVRNLADLLAKQGETEWGSVLFLLSTGEEKDLNVVRGWMKDRKEIGNINWSIGLVGIGVCEYYLRTGDSSVLPMIQKGADHLRDYIYNGGWSGRTMASYTYQSGGHLNAAGVHCLTFLLLAKNCGVDVDEATLMSSLRHFFRYAGRGSVPYGDYTSKPGYSDCNGKTGGLAMAMAAANRLTQGGEESVYSQAAQVSAMKSYYGTNTFHVGHTGGGIGELWKSTAMGVMVDKRPTQYRDYIDARRWILELSRRHTGGMGVGGGKDGNYNRATGEHNIAWGTFMALNYTLPRKNLYLFGAPSKWAKPYELPVRPWGNPADDSFCSPFSVPGPQWAQTDVFNESLHEHIGGPVEKRLNSPDVTDEEILRYLHHPEITHRFAAKEVAVKLKKDEIILGLLRSEDARLQHIGVMALHDLFGTWEKNNKDPERVTPAMMEQVEKIIRDPDGSWYAKQWALGLIQYMDIERQRSFKDLLAELVNHPEHWIQGSAMSASMDLLSDEASYKDLFPPIAQAISKTKVYSIVSRASAITKNLNTASPEIQTYGLEVMKKVYLNQPEDLINEYGGKPIPGAGPHKLKAIGQLIGFSEAGEEFLNSIPKTTSDWKISGRDRDKYTFSGRFKPNRDFIGSWGMLDHKEFTSKEEAIAFMRERASGKGPSLTKKDYKYGLTITEDGKVNPIGFIKMKYDFPLRYSGDMIYGTYVDKAYHYEIIDIAGRDYAMVEWDFEPGRDASYKAVFKTYVKLND